MKAMRKKCVHLAVTASMMAAMSVPLSAVGQTEAYVSSTNTGQALVFPYYTVNGGWNTSFSVINTSDSTLAIKVRFHERKNSRDVLDFTLVMSPRDSWTAWLDDSDAGPVLRTNDNSCTSPTVVDGVPMQRAAFTGRYDDTGGTGFNRMREGYLELLVMGEAATIATPTAGWSAEKAIQDKTSLYVPYHAKHVNGKPRNCDLVDEAFLPTTADWQEPPVGVVGENPQDFGGDLVGDDDSPDAGGSGDPLARIDFDAPQTNPLKGSITWTNAASGISAGTSAAAVADWSDKNMVTAQVFPWFLEPTFASGDGLWTVTGVANFENSILSTETMNEWADNPNNGAATDWIVNFPTKGFHVDKFNQQIQAAVSWYRNADTTTGDLMNVIDCGDPAAPVSRKNCTEADTQPIAVEPFEVLFGVGTNGVDPVTGLGESPVTVEYHVYDREETKFTITVDDETTISPAPPRPPAPIDQLRFESNVVQFSADQSVLGANQPSVVPAGELLGSRSGWTRLEFTKAVGGLPVEALMVKVRNTADSSTSYGEASANAYLAEPRVTPAE